MGGGSEMEGEIEPLEGVKMDCFVNFVRSTVVWYRKGRKRKRSERR